MKNINLWIRFDIEKMQQKILPYIMLGIGSDDGDKQINNMSELTDEDLDNIYFSLKAAEEVIESEFLNRKNENEKIRNEIDKLECIINK
jgi:hypothetical protein